MLQNYIKTTHRHLRKNKVNFILKLGGLTLALLSFLIIAIYVSFQLSFDRYHADYENIYRVNSERKENGKQEKYAVVPQALGPVLKSEFPEIESFSRIGGTNQRHIRYGQKIFDCHIIESDSSLFNVFTFQFVEGDRKSLTKPYSIVLTQSVAKKIFAGEEALHKLITLTNKDQIFEVTAIIEDMPSNSHLDLEAIIPVKNYEETFSARSIISPVEFVDKSAILYVRFQKATWPAYFTTRLATLLNKHISQEDRVATGFSVFFQPLKSIYLDTPLKYEFTKKGSYLYITIYSSLAILLLFVASINYINLSVADFNSRLREIGIRKAMGARKSQIALQVIVEAVAYILFALILSVGFLYVVFPKVIQLLEPNLRFEMITDGKVIYFLLVTLLLLVIFSTLFPAYRLAMGNSATELKGGFGMGRGTSVSRTLLLVQFIISIIAISASLIVGKQIQFIHNKDLGFDRKNLVVILMPEDFSVSKMKSLKNKLEGIAGVGGVSNSSFKVGGGYWKDWYTLEEGEAMKSVELYEVFSDDDLFRVLGMKLLEGRTFNASNPADSGAAYVINETAARELGWDEPVGKRITTHPEEKGKWDGTVIGVVRDIHIQSLHEKVQPLVMRLPWQKDSPEYFVYVRIDGPIDQTLLAIKKEYNEILPGYPIEYDFVDAFYNSKYQNENKAFASLQFGTWIIVLISGLGVFSLSIYMSLKRMKEFGIRKVLGATGRQIALLHVGHFLRITLLANIIGLPLAWWMMKAWLDDFAYKTEAGTIVFFSVAFISFLLVIISAGFSALRASQMNPVDVIRAQ